MRLGRPTIGLAACLGLCGCGKGIGGDGGPNAATFGTAASATSGAESATNVTKSSGQNDDGSSGDPATGSDDGSSSSASSGEATTLGPVDGEICNGLDDDGDGQIDESFGDLSCGVGACEVVVPACDNGVENTCTPLGGAPEVCNNIDDDCDGVVDTHQQACDTACGSGSETCVAGVWMNCDAPPVSDETCDLVDEDCDGTIDEGLSACRIGVHRSFGNGGHYYTTDLSGAGCCGFSLEFADYYDIYADPQDGLVGWYRCLKGNGKYFYTTSSTCEGQTVEALMGYVNPIDSAGARPLYRLYNASIGNHFYTVSAGERDNAVNNLGYVLESTACHVW